MIRQPRGNVGTSELFRILTEGAPILLGREVDIDASATTSTQSVRHGLGRAYRGAFELLCSANVKLRVLPPEGQEDPATYLYFALSAATATTARVWAF